MAPRTVEEIFRDYSARRTAIIRALTTELDRFCEICDPDEENLCLYGHPDESWEVTKPAELLPTDLPEPVPGINFSRDVMERKNWLTLIAANSDSWLISLAFLLGAQAGFTHNERNHLYSLINDLPTILEVVIPVQGTPSMDGGSKSEGSSSSSSRKRLFNGQMKIDLNIADDSHADAEDEHAVDDSHGDAEDEHVAENSHEDAEDEHAADDSHEDAEDEQSVTLCGGCGGKYDWISCDVCKRWFHVTCARMTASGEDNNEYECQFCSIEG